MSWQKEPFELNSKNKKRDSSVLERRGKKVFLQLLKYSAFKDGGKPYLIIFLERKWGKKL